MGTSLFNLDEAKDHPLWVQELHNFKDHKPETEEYGVTSFVYYAREPFDPSKIYNFFNREWPGIIRSKGFFWLSTRPDFVGEVSQAGAFVRHQGIGRWWAAVPEDKWPKGDDLNQVIKRYWNKNVGDRRQEIVFIGLKSEMNEHSIRKQLDDCLIKSYLTSPANYQEIPDPFPKWFQKTN